MRAVIQRVDKARVRVGREIIGSIGHGMLIFLAIHQDDRQEQVSQMATKLLNLRIFADQQEKMNLSLKDTGGEILVVSQFTLYADTGKGNRPSFFESAKPDKAERLYNQFIEILQQEKFKVASGFFGAKMEVELLNQGPVTLIIDV